MHEFLESDRAELVGRCRLKVSQRPRREPNTPQHVSGLPVFFEQLRRTLQAEDAHSFIESMKISGEGYGERVASSEIGQGDSGTLTVRNLPGEGCVFTISLPLFIKTTTEIRQVAH